MKINNQYIYKKDNLPAEIADVSGSDWQQMSRDNRATSELQMRDFLTNSAAAASLAVGTQLPVAPAQEQDKVKFLEQKLLQVQEELREIKQSGVRHQLAQQYQQQPMAQQQYLGLPMATQNNHQQNQIETTTAANTPNTDGTAIPNFDAKRTNGRLFAEI
jgi:hypothetical protein